MERNKIAEIITQIHKTPLEQADEILLLFGVMQRSEQLVCDKCIEGLNKSKFEKGTCIHCRKKIEQTNCA